MKFFVSFFFITLKTIFALSFPENIDSYTGSPLNVNNEVRLPLLGSENCAENEILYPSGENDWVCDCRPGYLFVPSEDKCYRAYESGPCNETSILILPPNSYEPKCVTDRCTLKRKVKLYGKCVKIGEKCQRAKKAQMTFGVVGLNEVTMKLNCLPMGKKAYTKLCNIGGKMDNKGMCIR